VRGGHDIYYFANSAEQPVDVPVTLRGDKHLTIWDPHTGTRSAATVTALAPGGDATTTVRLVLPPVHSLFFIQE
jgi:hypothetical protein